MLFNAPVATAFMASIALSAAMPKSAQNWEMVTNELGYQTVQFKPGFEPGSDDYYHRYGEIDVNSSSLFTRDSQRTTQPYMGNTRIPYGCNTDIGNYVFSKLHDVCGEDRCDSGTGISAEVEFPSGGYKKKASVNVKVTANYPRGSKDHMIRAVQAMVPQNGVDYYDVISYGPIQGGHAVPHNAMCEVVGSSNFFSVVVRNDDDEGLVGQMDLAVTFEMGENGAICGTIATVAKEIAGAINGIAGGLFGIVQAVSCK